MNRNNFHNEFIEGLIRKNIKITIVLTDGTKINGIIIGYDDYTYIINLTVKDVETDILVNKHAIQVIIPEPGFIINDKNVYEKIRQNVQKKKMNNQNNNIKNPSIINSQKNNKKIIIKKKALG